ncbi:MAG: hypothetical protein AVO33_07975 [delta proteobacterium ML8_F1]|nr:MAG: hypothetical protein AVO33_07975 [delta proteobacterium ML8_F1]
MKRKQRTEILIHCPTKVLRELSEAVESHHAIKILEEPNSGLVMVKMRETAMKTKFFLGEVLVTECKVLLGETLGLGILRGSHKKRAYYLAVIDAAFNADIDEIEGLRERIREESGRIQILQGRERQQILKTKVDFETLDEEVKA